MFNNDFFEIVNGTVSYVCFYIVFLFARDTWRAWRNGQPYSGSVGLATFALGEAILRGTVYIQRASDGYFNWESLLPTLVAGVTILLGGAACIIRVFSEQATAKEGYLKSFSVIVVCFGITFGTWLINKQALLEMLSVPSR